MPSNSNAIANETVDPFGLVSKAHADCKRLGCYLEIVRSYSPSGWQLLHKSPDGDIQGEFIEDQAVRTWARDAWGEVVLYFTTACHSGLDVPVIETLMQCPTCMRIAEPLDGRLSCGCDIPDQPKRRKFL